VATVGDVQNQWQRVQTATQWGWFADWWQVEYRAQRWGGQPQIVFPAMLALEGVADVTAVTLGVFAILLACAIVVLFRVLGAILGQAPFIGGWIESQFAGAAAWVWNLFAGWAHAAMDVVVTLAKWTWAVIQGIPALSVHFFETAFGAVSFIYDQVIPSAIGWVYNEARSFFNQAIGYVQSSINWLLGTTYHLFNTAIAFAQQVYGLATGYAAALFNQMATYAHALFSYAIAYVDQAVHGLEVQVQNDVRFLDGAIHDAEVGAQQALNNAVHGIEGEFAAVEATLGRVLNVDIPNAVHTLTGEIAVAASAAAAATAVVAREFTNWEENCGNKLCGGLLGDAEQALSMLKVLEDGAIFLFLAAAIHEPVQTADDSVAAVAPLVSAAGGLIDQLVGWAA
jgi:hypothetical protein